MLFFGGAGVKKNLHPSLKAYVDCFQSNPFPRMFPRGGGVWDQDPILMRDFRIIQSFERSWKESQEQIQQAQSELGFQSSEGGGGIGLDGAMNQYLESLGEDGGF